ncbi:GNAT family N-acetyltransferase [Paenibacillus rhizovicinus]|uniref:GNAT family N-acetyltransferase n=1 Tax=Paenibacillus rhizovicinus TaxID=2704463 RepID=A0A6C0P8R7_9BACL|nr:GNAT family N-acetyltransferase [Paenibacillus rhizovicinus]QHW34023.1 GNAT family N-acetyltransferase [Paenibacillus rhizovicinus]
MDYAIIDYDPSYALQTVTMWRASKEQAIGQPAIHSVEDHVYFLNHILTNSNKVYLAIERSGKQVAGILACNENWVNQLYIHTQHQGKGIGKKLLDLAKQQSDGKLFLYTFEVNKKAQRFYERNGFRIVARGNENEEQLDDIKYAWTR